MAQEGKQATPKLPTKAGAAQGDVSGWVKLCTKNEQFGNADVCLVKYEELDPKTGSVLLTAAVRTVEGEDKKDLLINVPTPIRSLFPLAFAPRLTRTSRFQCNFLFVFLQAARLTLN